LRRSRLAWEALNAVSDTRVCPYCREPTRAGWPLCDGCARTLPAERPLPDLRLVNELERWDRANPRPRDPAALTRRTLKWLWMSVVVLSALDLRFGRHIGTGISAWDTLAVGSIVLAFLGTLVGMFLLGVLSGRDPGATWRRERAQVRRRLGAGTPADP
jgi:hypothetical protein